MTACGISEANSKPKTKMGVQNLQWRTIRNALLNCRFSEIEGNQVYFEITICELDMANDSVRNDDTPSSLRTPCVCC